MDKTYLIEKKKRKKGKHKYKVSEKSNPNNVLLHMLIICKVTEPKMEKNRQLQQVQ